MMDEVSVLKGLNEANLKEEEAAAEAEKIDEPKDLQVEFSQMIYRNLESPSGSFTFMPQEPETDLAQAVAALNTADTFEELDTEEEHVVGEEYLTRLRSRMTPVTPDNGVMKQIVSPGFGDPVPKGSFVEIQFSLFTADDPSTPYDSTYAQGKPTRFRLGLGSVFPGLEMGVRSMCLGEKARFLVEPSWGYMMLQKRRFNTKNPMKYPFNVNEPILCLVQLQDFLDNGEAAEVALLVHEGREVELDLLFGAIEQQLRTAKNFYAKREISREFATKARFQYLEICRWFDAAKSPIPGTPEEALLKEKKCKVYTNLAIVFKFLGEPQRSVSHARIAVAEVPDDQKAVFQLIRGLRLSNEFNEASALLKDALQRFPSSEFFQREKIELSRGLKAYQERSRQFATKALRTMDSAISDNSEKAEEVKEGEPRGAAAREISQAFQELISRKLQNFASSNRHEMKVHLSHATMFEIGFFRLVAVEAGFEAIVLSSPERGLLIKKKTRTSEEESVPKS